MTRFTKDEVAQIVTGVIQGNGPKSIAMRLGRKLPSVTDVIQRLQKDKPLFQRMLDGESVDAIAQSYVDAVFRVDSERGQKMMKARLKNNGGTQLSRIEAKLDELLALYKVSVGKDYLDSLEVKASSPIVDTYNAQGKRRSFFG